MEEKLELRGKVYQWFKELGFKALYDAPVYHFTFFLLEGTSCWFCVFTDQIRITSDTVDEFIPLPETKEALINVVKEKGVI
jgi:hypothetical protein